jgi:hypothetical protein
MFTQNKYNDWYYKIIDNAKTYNRVKIKGEYLFESHHIIPKSLGGIDEDNIVLLTYREHFLCHWLLTKMTDGDNKIKMELALSFMCKTPKRNKRLYTGWQFEIARKNAHTFASGDNHWIVKEGGWAGWQEKTGKQHPRLGKKHSIESKRKNSESHRGEKHNLYGTKQSNYTVEKRRKSMLGKNVGKVKTDIEKEKCSKRMNELTNKGKHPFQNVCYWVCGYCEVSGSGMANYTRYHGDKCKMKCESVESKVIGG